MRSSTPTFMFSVLAASLLPSCSAFVLPHVITPCARRGFVVATEEIRGGNPVDAAEKCQDEQGIRDDAEAAFRLLDLDGDGEITDVEMKSYLQEFKYSGSAIDKIYGALDMDGCGVIHLDDLRDGLAEYCRCAKCESSFVADVHAEADGMFELVDTDGDGTISVDEMRSHLLKNGYTETASDALFKSLDADGNGTICQEELRAGFLKFSMLREAIVAVVTTLVKQKKWSPRQQQTA